MRRRLTAILLSSGAAVLAFSTATALAATTWTVRPGGPTSGRGAAAVKDTSTGTSLQCTASSIAITWKSGSGLGSHIGDITTLTFNGCGGPAGLKITLTTTASPANPWPLNARSFLSGVIHGTISNARATLSGPGCRASLAGPTADTTATVSFSYANATSKFKIGPGGNLHIWHVSGCLGLINSGDTATLTGTYTISPHQTITSP